MGIAIQYSKAHIAWHVAVNVVHAGGGSWEFMFQDILSGWRKSNFNIAAVLKERRGGKTKTECTGLEYITVHHMTFLENSRITRGCLTVTCHLMHKYTYMRAYFPSNSFVNQQKYISHNCSSINYTCTITQLFWPGCAHHNNHLRIGCDQELQREGHHKSRLFETESKVSTESLTLALLCGFRFPQAMALEQSIRNARIGNCWCAPWVKTMEACHSQVVLHVSWQGEVPSF